MEDAEVAEKETTVRGRMNRDTREPGYRDSRTASMQGYRDLGYWDTRIQGFKERSGV